MKKISLLLFVFVTQSDMIWAQSNWQSMGPFNRTGGNGQGSGRIYSIAHDPQYNGTTNKTVFGSTPFGGLWISKNAGASWSNTDTDYPGLNTDKLNGCGVMDVIVDQTDPHILYAASYHSNPMTSAGVWKYTKTGTTTGGWAATGLSWAYPSSKQMYKLTMHPTNHLIVLAGTSDGIYRTADGGISWNLVYAHTTANNYGIKNIVFRPGSSTEVYASADKVYKSIDAGINWVEIPNFPIPNADWVDIAVTSAGNFYCYFLVGQTSYFYYYTGSWNSKKTFPFDRLEYNQKRLCLVLNPTNDNIVYSGQEQLHRYDLGADKWATISSYNGDMHADMHKLIFSPDKKELWVGHDGGISMANTNLTTGTPNWSTKNTGLSIATIYSFSGSPKESSKYIVGEEDNGDSYYDGTTWQGYQVSDGGDKMIDYNDPKNWFDKQEMYAGSNHPFYRNTTGMPGYSNVTTVFDKSSNQPFTSPTMYYWEDFGVAKPLIQDPKNPNIIYKAGINGLWRSFDYGTTSQAILLAGCIIGWPHFVTSVAIAHTNPNYIYVNGYSKYDRTVTDKVVMTQMALSCPYRIYNSATQNNDCTDPNAPNCECSCWTDITPVWPGGFTTTQLSYNNISSVVVSDKDPNKIWIGYNRMTAVATDRTTYQIKMRENGAWTDYNDGLPTNADIYGLIYERGSNDGIYAATTEGLYYRNASDSQWNLFDNNLPRASVKKMEINYTDNTIRVGLYGRGIWKSSLMCPSQNTLTLNGLGIAPGFREANYIVAGGGAVTATASATIFRATKSVTLNPSFIAEAVSGGSFLAFIHGCSSPGNSFLVNQSELDDLNINTNIKEEEEQNRTDENSILVTPNPNNGFFTLSIASDEVKFVSVYDLMGKLVFSTKQTKESIIPVNINHLPQAVYIVKVQIGNRYEVKRVIKE